MPNKCCIIGITGGIGSGKSTVCSYLVSCGYKVYDCDTEAKRLMNNDIALQAKIKTLLGNEAYDKNECLNRQLVSKKVFSDKTLLTQLDSIVHPAVKNDILNHSAQSDKGLLFVESAILFESGISDICDFTINICSSLAERIARTAVRDKKSVDEVEKRISSQMSEEEREKLADITLLNPNGQNIEILGNKIIKLINKMKKMRIAIVGYGNIGKAAIEAVNASRDMELVGIVRRSLENLPDELKQYKVVTDIQSLADVDVALLCVPTREVPHYAENILSLGINTIDSFDIHGKIAELRTHLTDIARQNNAVAVVSAGWDPGSDSVVRCILEAISPKGITYTNFGPGRSMGHSVAARAVEGVEDALSMTIPLGTGIHRRMVYVQVKAGYDFETIKAKILADDYFCHDETHVIKVENVDDLNDVGHGVNMVRKGVSGTTHNQRFEFNMSINNPSLTAQIMVCCARATRHLLPGAYTMIEIPPIDLLEGDRLENIKKLV